MLLEEYTIELEYEENDLTYAPVNNSRRTKKSWDILVFARASLCHEQFNERAIEKSSRMKDI